MVADGLPMYGESPARYGVTWAAGHLGNLNPPHFQILFVPLASLPYGQALLAWVAFSFACLVASLVVIFRELQVPFTWTRFVSWGAFTIGLAPFTTVAVTSEMTFVLMLPFALLWRAWRRGHWVSAGAWLGVLVSLKLFFLRPCGLAGPAARMAGPGRLRGCDPRAGPAGRGSLRLRRLPSVDRVAGHGRLAVDGHERLLARIRQPRAARRRHDRTGHPGALARAAHGGARRGLRAGGHAAIDWRGPDDVGWREWALLVLLLGAILASPLGWVYYLPLAYAPVLGWMGAGEGWARLKKLPRPALAVFVIAIALLYTPQEVANAGQPSALATLTLASAYFYATALLWLMLDSPEGTPELKFGPTYVALPCHRPLSCAGWHPAVAFPGAHGRHVRLRAGRPVYPPRPRPHAGRPRGLGNPAHRVRVRLQFATVDVDAGRFLEARGSRRLGAVRAERGDWLCAVAASQHGHVGQGFSPAHTIAITCALVLVTPLPTLAFIGMEHTLQVLLVVIFAWQASERLAGERHDWLWPSVVAALWSRPATSRLFIVAVVGAILLWQGKLVPAIVPGRRRRGARRGLRALLGGARRARASQLGADEVRTRAFRHLWRRRFGGHLRLARRSRPVSAASRNWCSP